MLRKIWVRRGPHASATRVEVHEDDLVDGVRDVILRKYANSLGRNIDSPDISLKIISREQANKNVVSERILGPEESIGQTLDAYYPGGQTIDEALIIDVPQRRTPKPSPRPGNHHMPYYSDEFRPGEAARDYFGPIPLQSPQLNHLQQQIMSNGTHGHSMSVLATGQLPPIPSPGPHPSRRARPKYARQHTSSPTILHTSQPNGVGIEPKVQVNGVTTAVPSLPTPPAQPEHLANSNSTNRTTSPHPRKGKTKNKATRDVNAEPPLPATPASATLLDGKVPPINVLIVEDNSINLRLLEQFMRRLKVRWKTAMNGREAVNVWREGGFHLVLMDIQLPVMSGLEATKEIRRLESMNGIGINVFGDGGNKSQDPADDGGQLRKEDVLPDRSLFKSPVIIVALTASSLQSDRHEALAVGCNDFLTKPVNFTWMERKVTEWGCMQALIDFDGWRKWKEIEAKKASMDPEIIKAEEKEARAKARADLRAAMMRPPPVTSSKDKKDTESKRKESSRSSPGGGHSVTGGGIVTSPTSEHPPSAPSQSSGRRSHKGSRSGGGGLGTTLATTTEEDEKT